MKLKTAKIALEKLKNTWRDHVERSNNLDTEMSDSVSFKISQLYEDWLFFHNISAEKNWKNWNSGIENKVYNMCIDIGKEIDDKDYRKNSFKNLEKTQKLDKLLDKYRGMTDEILKPETGAAMERFFKRKFERWSVYSPKMKEIKKNMELIKSAHVTVDALLHELEQITQYLDEMRFVTWKLKCEDCPFLSRLASVLGNTVRHLFDIRINRHNVEMAKVRFEELVHLWHRIDPANPEFMKLFLSFQVSVQVYGGSSYVNYFCDYLLPDSLKSPLDVHGNVRDDLLRPLVNLYIYLYEHQPSHEDFSSLSSEVVVVLSQLASLHRSLPHPMEADSPRSPNPYSNQLFVKVSVLYIQFFIKEQLIKASSSSSNGFIDDNFFGTLRTFVEDQKQKMYVSCVVGQYSLLLKEMSRVLQSLKSEGAKNRLDSLHQLLYRITFYKVESLLLEILTKNLIDESLIDSLKSELEYIQQFVISKPMSGYPEEDAVFQQLMTFICSSILPSSDKEIILLLPQLSNKVKHMKRKLKKIYLGTIALPSFPKTCNLGFLKFLCRNIQEVINYQSVSIAPMKHQLEQVYQQLEALKSLMMKVSELELENGDLSGHISETIHKIEFVVESVEVGNGSKLRLTDLLEDIQGINLKIEMSSAVSTNAPLLVSTDTLSRDAKSARKKIMQDAVLFNEENDIVDRLKGGLKPRDVIYIVGMAGVGKTTLARKVYNDEKVMYHFSRRAWCTVSKAYSERGMLLDIMSGIHEISNDIREMTDDDLRSKVRHCLLGNKYLIVLDDVWDIKVWDFLQMSFPNENKGSRILITSRQQDLHSKINLGRDPFHLDSFSDEKSWELLQMKIFGKGASCPDELLLLGKQIAHHCQGLPLAIVAITGILQRTEKTRDWWEKVSKSLCTRVMKDPESKCREILELSYKHLPGDLKACFIYLGMFLGDMDIPVSKLIRLWIAEGFVQETEFKSLHEVAQDYLMELINRSLLIISKKRSNGMVKTCRLHDLLRDLCQSKANDDNFFDLVTMDDERYALFPSSRPGMKFYNKGELDPVIFKSYRLSINMRRDIFFGSRPSGPTTRSLLFFASADDPKRPCEISAICKNFRLLRVLELECINIGASFPDEIGLMIQLRYLAVSGYLGSIPSSIAKLQKLLFLVVTTFEGNISLPRTIWNMVNLRHLHVNKHVSFDLNGGDEDKVVSLDNLVSFCTPCFSFGDDTINLLKRLPNLLKMKCKFLECNRFPVLDFLTRLENLKIIYPGIAIASGEFILPFSLKKLTLSGFLRLPWSHVARVGVLPNLRVLKLLSGEFEGPKWEMNEDEFKELEFLKLENLNIVEWVANSYQLPNLIKLVLRNCKYLEEIPQDFESISTLEIIQVQWCKNSVEESAKNIGDAAEGIQVDISYN